jgi:CBS domain-containing protein
MKVRDIMTTDVITVGPEDSLKDVASILAGMGISGVPVCDVERRVVGVISEADILYKELDTRDRAGIMAAWLVAGPGGKKVRKAGARSVREAMTTPAITISPTRSIAEAARVMTVRKFNRLPVVKGDSLVGIITRADLVRAFVRSDDEIRREIVDDVIVDALGLSPSGVRVDVRGGGVHLGGTLKARSDALLVQRLVGRVPGVVSIESELAWSVDDTRCREAVAPS